MILVEDIKERYVQVCAFAHFALWSPQKRIYSKAKQQRILVRGQCMVLLLAAMKQRH